MIGTIHSNAVAGHHQNQNNSSSVALITGAPANHTTSGARSNSSNSSSGSNSSSHNQCIDRVLNNPSNAVKTLVVRYNRRNNPELEKRRIHHCDFLGEFYTLCTTVCVYLYVYMCARKHSPHFRHPRKCIFFFKWTVLSARHSCLRRRTESIWRLTLLLLLLLLEN